MSRPKYWWYDYVKKSIIRNLGTGTAPETWQEYLCEKAVKKCTSPDKGPVQRRRAPENDRFGVQKTAAQCSRYWRRSGAKIENA